MIATVAHSLHHPSKACIIHPYIPAPDLGLDKDINHSLKKERLFTTHMTPYDSHDSSRLI